MSERAHVYTFLVCYVMVGLFEPLVASGALMLTLFKVYFYLVMTPSLVAYSVWAYTQRT